MDESLHELEAELKSLRPRRPASPLLDRLERELAAPRAESSATAKPLRYAAATNLNSWKWLGWQAAGVAALALIVTVSWIKFGEKAAPDPVAQPRQLAGASPATPARRARSSGVDRYQPVTATNVLYDLKDEGTVYVDGDTPARQLRYRYVDTYTWKNPRNNASLKWSMPRDEIRVLPASLN
jgi:hypothetical protein